nr:response regulator [Paenibacillus sp. PL91]
MNKVLIVDDEPWAREVIKALVDWDRLGLAIAGEAEDGSQALHFIKEHKPQIVITDMRMPGLDGVEFLKALNEQFPSIKIIVMSGYDDFVYLKQAIRSRAVEYLLKPVDETELNEALHKCIFELENEKQTVHTASRSPIVFPNAQSMDRYGGLRKRVFGTLFELSKPALLQALDKLEALLEDTFSNGIDSALLAKIGDDFLRMLAEFVSENGTDFEAADLELENSKRYENVSDLMRTVANAYGAVIDKMESIRKSKNRLVILEVQHYIDQHYMDPISLETVAYQFYVTKEHLSRAFKSTIGENLTEYMTRKRMEKAKQLLMQSDVSIKQAAQMTGYSELAYFHRVFKKHFGVTPGEIRSGNR